VLSQITLTQSSPVIKNQGESLQLKCSITGFDIYNHYMQWLMKKPGVLSQITLTQSSPIIKNQGESLQLKCSITGFDIYNHYMDWLMKKPGYPLKCWCTIVSPRRFTASKDSSNFYLQMNDLKVEDTAVYYCTSAITHTMMEKNHDKREEKKTLLVCLFMLDIFLMITLTQSSLVRKKRGESVQLKCSITGFDIIHHYMNWLMKRPWKPLEWLVYYRTPKYSGYFPGIQGNFTASKDSSNFYLQMNDLKMEDT
ncbi:hypothetical protein L345_15209, partial [Ophiophagus hannah]